MSIEIILMGLLVGGLVGMTGVGGASLLTPILVFWGINPAIAIGTDFAYNTITKLFGAVQHIRQKTVNFQLVKHLAIGSLPAAIIANIVFYSLLSNHYNEKFIVLLLGYVLIIVSIISLIQLIFVPNPVNQWKAKTLREKRFITILAGVVIGAIVGVTSVGSGSLFALFILYFYNVKSSELVGTDITHAFLLVLVSGLLMARLGNIDYVLVGNLVCGSIPGAIIGSKLTKKIPHFAMRILIVAIILCSGIALVS
ncbi:sulfite exporter TauE/SafE family protein [Peribacillus cavernae]|uniref:Probable membrane transporter protein n=1 Tax=Peribacillus cavernae TaxID=1674310 RepID=A0A3S0TWN9_9BACI|nr:sulfite exporter TauE/SafE family protein [Peribacillus cavernae]MDQ0218923.1 putative membrane protein YfcA [Peribacillus cavernae]RUQ29364.1 sulfite exporter TauE/SafE family protein [Peribacillus cavernae]